MIAARVVGFALLALAGGCGGARLHPHAAPAGASAQKGGDVCSAPVAPVAIEPSPIVPSVEPPWGARIARVEVIGVTHIPRELALQAIHVREGSAFDSAAVAKDVLALHELEAIEAVEVDAERLDGGDRVVLRYILRERRVVGEVSYRWPNPLIAGHWVPLARGELYDPARVDRTRIDLEGNLVEEGHLGAKVEERQKARGADRVDVCFLVDAGPKFVIERIGFTGNERVSQADLAPLIHSHDDRANQPAKPYRDDLLENDLLYVSALYYDRGHLEVKVGPPRTTTKLDPSGNGHITVEIPIQEGPAYRVRDVRFAASAARLAVEYKRRLGINSGDVFSRARIMEGFEKIRELHRARGEAIEVTPETTLDPARGEVDLVIDVKRTSTRPPGSKGTK